MGWSENVRILIKLIPPMYVCRREHLSEEDVKKNKEMVEAFQRGDTSLMESEKTQTFPRKESLAPPPKTTCTWNEYISADKYVNIDFPWFLLFVLSVIFS